MAVLQSLCELKSNPGVNPQSYQPTPSRTRLGAVLIVGVEADLPQSQNGLLKGRLERSPAYQKTAKGPLEQLSSAGMCGRGKGGGGGKVR